MKFDLVNCEGSKGVGNSRLVKLSVVKQGKRNMLRVSLMPHLLEQAELKVGDAVTLHGSEDGKITLKAAEDGNGWVMRATSLGKETGSHRVAVNMPAPEEVLTTLGKALAGEVSTNKSKQSITFKLVGTQI